MKSFLSIEFICCVTLVTCLLVNVTNEAKNEKVKRSKKGETTTPMITVDDRILEKSRPGGGDDIGYLPLREPLVINDLEEAYIRHFENCTQTNGTNLWLEAKKMERQDKLAAMCTRAHFLHGGDMYETIEQAKVMDGNLHFMKEENKKRGPVRINVVRYKSDLEDKYYHLTKGIKSTCVFYLQPLNDSKSDYFLSECVQEVPMPAL